MRAKVSEKLQANLPAGSYRLRDRIKTMDGKILRGTQNVKNLKGYKDSRNLQDQIHV